GAGGTQRLPRLIGAEAALDLILSGKPLKAKHAKLLGIVDHLAQGPDSLLDEACGFARHLLADAAPAQPRPTHAQPGAGLPSSFFSDYQARHAPRWRGQQAPQRVLDAVQAACELPLAAGLRHES